jgi:hypothetical protein
MSDHFDERFNKFSVHYDRKKDKDWHGDDRVVRNKTFIVKM